ncbi:hypothetical protein ACEPAF_2462 [Sanghuangporus sanghuang]
MDDFSWTDGVRATISTCLPCFSSRTAHSEAEQEQENSSTRRGQQTRYEELEGLLRNDPSDTDGGDAETMSLHSNLGSGEGRRKRNKNRRKNRNYKSVQLFGFHLFGRPPIQLSDSENDDEEVDGSHRRRARNRPGHLTIGQLSSAHSSSSADAETFGAFDSDASPLDPTLISQLSPQDAAARAARAAAEREEEEARRRQEQLEKEERRRRRRERKEAERRAAMGVSMDGQEFEGFPGSGSLRPPFSPLSPGSLSSIPTSPPAPAEEFGPYVGALPLPPLASANPPRSRHGLAAGDDGEGEDEADFGGEAYTRKAHPSSRGSRGSDNSRSHSQSQSQTSASRSNADSSHYYYPYPQQQPMYFSQTQASPLPSPNNPASGAGASGPFTSHHQKKKPKSKSKSKRSSNSATTGTTTTSTGSRSPTSQSTSLPSLDSPIPPNLSASKADVPPTSEPIIVQHDEEPRAQPQLHSGVIFPADVANENGNADNFDSNSKFPAVGFGGRRTNSSGSTSGVFLARRGDD